MLNFKAIKSITSLQIIDTKERCIKTVEIEKLPNKTELH
jgi:hypothetical protein